MKHDPRIIGPVARIVAKVACGWIEERRLHRLILRNCVARCYTSPMQATREQTISDHRRTWAVRAPKTTDPF